MRFFMLLMMVLTGGATVGSTSAPLIISIRPGTVSAGLSSVSVSVVGIGFAPGATVLLRGVTLPTNVVSSNELSVSVPGALLAAPGIEPFLIRNPDGATTTPGRDNLTIWDGPVILSMVPSAVPAGSSAVGVSIYGLGFVPGSTLLFNGTVVSTTFSSPNELSATIPQNLLAMPGVVPVMVRRPNGTMTTPGRDSFEIVGGPVISSIQPSSVAAGSPGAGLSIAGMGFLPDAAVLFNGIAIPTTFKSPNEVSATVPASLLTKPGTVPLMIRNADGTNTTLGRDVVTIWDGPVVVRVTPSTVSRGSSGVGLSVLGTGFVPGGIAFLNGTAVPTTFVSANEISAAIPPSLLGVAGSLPLLVRNPNGSTNAPGKDNLTVWDGPVISSITPSTVPVGLPGVGITVTGMGIDPAAVVLARGVAVPTTFVNRNQVTASIPADLLTSAGAVSIVVRNVDGAATTPGKDFLTIWDGPVISSVTPDAVSSGTPGITVKVDGLGFVSGAVASFDNVTIPTVVLNSTELVVDLPANLLKGAGTVPLTIRNPNGRTTTPGKDHMTLWVGPVIQVMSPGKAPAGISEIRLGIVGTGFVPGTAITFNGSEVPTAFIAPNEISVNVPGSLLAEPGTVRIVARNVDGTTSVPGRDQFQIFEPLPVVERLSPNSVPVGGGTLLLRVIGSGFFRQSKIRFNEATMETRFVNSAVLEAQIPGEFTARPATAAISVSNPTSRSNSVPLTVACDYTLSSQSSSVHAIGEVGSFTVNANCPWTANSTVPWIAVTVAGTKVTYTVGRNIGDPRLGSVVVNGKPFTVDQKAGTCGAVDITDLVKTPTTGFTKESANSSFVTGTITVHNSSDTPIEGPISVVTQGIPRGSGTNRIDIVQGGSLPMTRCFSSIGDYVLPWTPGSLNGGAALPLPLTISLPSNVSVPPLRLRVISGALNR